MLYLPRRKQWALTLACNTQNAVAEARYFNLSYVPMSKTHNQGDQSALSLKNSQGNSDMAAWTSSEWLLSAHSCPCRESVYEPSRASSDTIGGYSVRRSVAGGPRATRSSQVSGSGFLAAAHCPPCRIKYT